MQSGNSFHVFDAIYKLLAEGDARLRCPKYHPSITQNQFSSHRVANHEKSNLHISFIIYEVVKIILFMDDRDWRGCIASHTAYL